MYFLSFFTSSNFIFCSWIVFISILSYLESFSILCLMWNWPQFQKMRFGFVLPPNSTMYFRSFSEAWNWKTKRSKFSRLGSMMRVQVLNLTVGSLLFWWFRWNILKNGLENYRKIRYVSRACIVCEEKQRGVSQTKLILEGISFHSRFLILATSGAGAVRSTWLCEF